jgi:hypothetical protein
MKRQIKKQKNIVYLLIGFLSIVLLFNCSVASAATSIFIGNKHMNLSTDTFVKDGRTYLPIRDILQALGMEFAFNNNTKEITATDETYNLIFKINSKSLIVNDQILEMDCTPLIVNGTTFLPLRPIANAIHASIEIESSTNNIIIKRKSGADIKIITFSAGTSKNIKTDGEFIYYNVGYNLYRTPLNDFEKRELIATSVVTFFDFFIYNDHIYCVVKDTVSYKDQVVEMNRDGSNSKVIYDGNILDFLGVYEGYLLFDYFDWESKSEFFSVRISDGEKISISELVVHDMDFKDGWIYFGGNFPPVISKKKNMKQEETRAIYRVKPDGEGLTRIKSLTTSSTYKVLIYKEWIYYIDQDPQTWKSYVYRIQLDGSNKKRISSTEGTTYFHIVNDSITFNRNGVGLFQCDLSGDQLRKISGTERDTYFFSLVNDTIYYIRFLTSFESFPISDS